MAEDLITLPELAKKEGFINASAELRQETIRLYADEVTRRLVVGEEDPDEVSISQTVRDSITGFDPELGKLLAPLPTQVPALIPPSDPGITGITPAIEPPPVFGPPPKPGEAGRAASLRELVDVGPIPTKEGLPTIPIAKISLSEQLKNIETERKTRVGRETVFQLASRRSRIGAIDLEKNLTTYQQMMANTFDDPENVKTRGVINAQLRELEGKDPELDLSSPSKFFRAVVGESAQVSPFLARTITSGTAAGLAAGVLATLAGQAGPQALVPEELVTVPLATTAGFTSGVVYFVTKAEAGAAYERLRRNGVRHKVAKGLALTAGTANGLIEIWQFGVARRFFAGAVTAAIKSRLKSKVVAEVMVSEPAKSAGKKLITAVGRGGAKSGLFLAKEVGQENLQEVSNISAEIAGSVIEKELGNQGVPRPTIEDTLTRLKEISIRSSLAILPLAVAGGSVSVGIEAGIPIRFETEFDEKESEFLEAYQAELEERGIPTGVVIEPVEVIEPELALEPELAPEEAVEAPIVAPEAIPAEAVPEVAIEEEVAPPLAVAELEAVTGFTREEAQRGAEAAIAAIEEELDIKVDFDIEKDLEAFITNPEAFLDEVSDIDRLTVLEDRLEAADVPFEDRGNFQELIADAIAEVEGLRTDIQQFEDIAEDPVKSEVARKRARGELGALDFGTLEELKATAREVYDALLTVAQKAKKKAKNLAEFTSNISKELGKAPFETIKKFVSQLWDALRKAAGRQRILEIGRQVKAVKLDTEAKREVFQEQVRDLVDNFTRKQLVILAGQLKVPLKITDKMRKSEIAAEIRRQELRLEKKAKPLSQSESRNADIQSSPFEASSNRLRSAIAFVEDQILPGGLLPQKLIDRKAQKFGQLRNQLKKVSRTTARIDKLIKEHFGIKREKLTDEQTKLLRDASEGKIKALRQLPLKLHKQLRIMRSEIDTLSNKMLAADGLIEGKLRETIANNKGIYLHRAFSLFSDPNWADNVPKEARKAARGLLENQMPDATEKQIGGFLQKLLFAQPDGPIATIKNSGISKKATSILLPRNDELHPIIKALWGEITDPVLAYQISSEKMITLLEDHKFLTDVRQIGLDEGYFTTADNPVPRLVSEISQGNEKLNPLKGIHTLPEITKAFQDAYANRKNFPIWMRAYLFVNGLTKYQAVIGSVSAHARQFVGNSFFASINGHFDVTKVKTAFQIVLSDFSNKGDTEMLAILQEFNKRNLLADNARPGELMATVRDIVSRGEDLNQYTARMATTQTEKVFKLGGDVYRVGDDVYKVFGVLNDLNRYQKVFPQAKDTKGKPSQGFWDFIANRRTRRTYPVFSLVPKTIKALRLFPFIGGFPSFAAEFMRTSWNSVEIAINELQGKTAEFEDFNLGEVNIKELKKIGAMRMAGILLAWGGASAITAGFATLFGKSDQDDKDIRRLGPPWMRNGSLAHWFDNKDGDPRYINLSYTNPNSYLLDPIRAGFQQLMEDDPDAYFKAGIEAIKEFAEPYVAEEILIQSVSEALSGRTEGGKPVWSEADDVGERVQKGILHISKDIVPSTIRRFSTNKEITASRLGAEITGLRMETLDRETSLKFKTRDFFRLWRINNSDFIFLVKGLDRDNPTPSPEEILIAYNKANAHRKALFIDISKDFHAAVRLGLDSDKAENVLKARKISERLRDEIISGTYINLKISDDTLREVFSADPPITIPDEVLLKHGTFDTFTPDK